MSLINLFSSVYTMWWILSTYNIYNYRQFLCIRILSIFKRENTIGIFIAHSQNTYLQEGFFNIEHVNINFTTMCWRISLIIIKENQQTPRSFQPCIFGPQPFNISLISSSREHTNSEHMRPGIKKTAVLHHGVQTSCSVWDNFSSLSIPGGACHQPLA